MSIGGGIAIFFGLILVLVVVVLSKTIKIIPQATAGVVERFGKYRSTLNAGLNVIMPFIDSVRYTIDLREQVVSFAPQPVITEDNLVVSIDTVLYFQVTDPIAATYEIANYIQAVEQLTMTTLRNIVGGMDLEETLTSREDINAGLRGVLDEATGKWGIRVNRVEIKGIDPPVSIKDSMEKQMRADRDKRATILTAEGVRQSAILTAEGNKQAAILNAEGDKQAAILRAEGEGQAITTVFRSIHEGDPDQKLLAYQYLQMLPRIAAGDSNKLWIVPSEIGKALEGLGNVDRPAGRRGCRRHAVTGVEYVLVAFAGLAAGTINTIVGSGTLITFPVLLAFGVPPVVANASNSIGLVPGSVSGAIGYRSKLKGQGRLVLRLLPASFGGALLGRDPVARAAVGRLRCDRSGSDRARSAARRVPALGRASYPRRRAAGVGARFGAPTGVAAAHGGGRRRLRRLLRRRPGRDPAGSARACGVGRRAGRQRGQERPGSGGQRRVRPGVHAQRRRRLEDRRHHCRVLGDRGTDRRASSASASRGWHFDC